MRTQSGPQSADQGRNPVCKPDSLAALLSLFPGKQIFVAEELKSVLRGNLPVEISLSLPPLPVPFVHLQRVSACMDG